MFTKWRHFFQPFAVPADYRTEIDGLRAVAVVPVILFHAGLSYFSGGYVGVDIFFVISGYLITGVILEEIEQGKFSLAQFYERRARRILPALFFMMLVCLPFAWKWMLPSHLKSFSDSLAATAGFVSNILYWKTAGYFDLVAEKKPLVHTWSLAVEEQYYLFFPLLMLLVWRWGKTRLLLLITFLAGLSFVGTEFSIFGILWGYYGRITEVTETVTRNFFIAPTRAWEFFIGSILAFLSFHAPLHSRVPRILAELLALAGLTMIAASIIYLTPLSRTPSFKILAPTLGTALIIAFAFSQTVVGRLLSLRPIVFIGLISYSAYLWHQPIFAFARVYSLDTNPKEVPWLLCIASIFLGWLSWRFVERPFRNRNNFTQRQIFAFSAAGTLFFLVIGLVGHYAEGFPSRLRTKEGKQFSPAPTAPDLNCNDKPLLSSQYIKECHLGTPGVEPSVVLIGDSHALAIAPGLHTYLQKQNKAGLYARNLACSAFPGIYNTPEGIQKADELCMAAHKEILDYVAHSPTRTVLLAWRWTFELYPITGAIEEPIFDNYEGGVEIDSPTKHFALDAQRQPTLEAPEKSAAISKLVKNYVATGKNVLLIHPVPEVGWNMNERNMKAFLRSGEIEESVSTSYDRYKSRHAFVESVFASLKAPNLVHVHPDQLFCDTFLPGRCMAQHQKIPFYSDDDHLSTYAANLLVDWMAKNIEL